MGTGGVAKGEPARRRALSLVMKFSARVEGGGEKPLASAGVTALGRAGASCADCT